jgi:hypothetical protein
MKSRIQIIIETEVGQHVEEIACLERDGYRLEDIGLTLTEGKNSPCGNSENHRRAANRRIP